MYLKTLERALLVDEVRVVLFAELLIPSALVGLLRLLLLILRLRRNLQRYWRRTIQTHLKGTLGSQRI